MNLKKLLVTFSHSLFWQISCFLLVVTAFAFGALFLVLQISEDSTGKGSAINVSGSRFQHQNSKTGALSPRQF